MTRAERDRLRRDAEARLRLAGQSRLVTANILVSATEVVAICEQIDSLEKEITRLRGDLKR